MTATDSFLNKIKKLQVDEIYSVDSISNKDAKNRVYLSRLGDNGTIVKPSKGYFYKPITKTLYKKSNKTIPLQKSMFVNDLFWSVSDGL